MVFTEVRGGIRACLRKGGAIIGSALGTAAVALSCQRIPLRRAL